MYLLLLHFCTSKQNFSYFGFSMFSDTETHDLETRTAGPLLSGHPQDFVNRGRPFNRGIEYCSLETLK